MACCGDVPTLETLAAVELLRSSAGVKIRVVNVVDLMKLQPPEEHPHGLPQGEFDAIFTVNKPVIFAFHGYPWLIHRLTYRRTNHENLHVRGYKEEGTTTTPFDIGAERSRPFRPGGRRLCPRAETRRYRGLLKKPSAKAPGPQKVHCQLWRRHAGDSRLEMVRRRLAGAAKPATGPTPRPTTSKNVFGESAFVVPYAVRSNLKSPI